MAFRRVNHHEAAAADIAGSRIGHGHGETGRYRCIDRVAAPLQHVGADSRRDFFLRDDHAMFGDNGMNSAGSCGYVRAAALLLCVGREVACENQHGCREDPAPPGYG